LNLPGEPPLTGDACQLLASSPNATGDLRMSDGPVSLGVVGQAPWLS